jgi:hypothetical protein
MFSLDNETPLPAALVPGVDERGATHVTLVVKATYRLRDGHLALADEQAPLREADEHHGEPGASSVRYESDLGPQKPGTDVVLVGHARSPSPVESLDVTLSAGRLRKVVRVFGDRAFFASGSGFGISAPRPFMRMPLVYERAYGGAAGAAFEERNPVGLGFCQDPESADGLRLPNLEDPRRLIAGPEDRPPVAGFGFVARHWMPRYALAGTYDDAWRAERFPLLPVDFDKRHFHAAHPDLVSAKPFSGGEQVGVEGASEGGPIGFRIPRLDLDVEVSIKRSRSRVQATLDTVVIEPDERRVTLLHRATFPCPRSYLDVDRVSIGALRGAA